MPKNALLVRWRGGYVTRTDSGSVGTYGRREAFLSTATLESSASTNAAADTALSLYSSPQSSITCAYEPANDAETPYLGVFPGDTLSAPDAAGNATTYRVEGFTVTEDENGELSYTPELSSLVETDRRRQQTWLARIGQGTLGGRSSSAALLDTLDPDVTRGRLPTQDRTFSKGVLAVEQSPPLLLSQNYRLTMLVVSLGTAGSSTTSVRILQGGSPLSFSVRGVGGSTTSTLSLTAGQTRKIFLAPNGGDLPITPGTQLTVDLTAVGTGAENLVVTATLADVF